MFVATVLVLYFAFQAYFMAISVYIDSFYKNIKGTETLNIISSFVLISSPRLQNFKFTIHKR